MENPKQDKMIRPGNPSRLPDRDIRHKDKKQPKLESKGEDADDSVLDLYDINRSGICDLCGGDTNEIKCKVQCPYCGYIRDCSDP